MLETAAVDTRSAGLYSLYANHHSPQGNAALEERECDLLLSAISVISLGSSFLMDFLIFVCQVM